MYLLTCRNILCGVADGVSVLDHIFASLNGADSILVTGFQLNLNIIRSVY